jgi:hypothetical protein
MWCCANRVEHGSKISKSSPTVIEADLFGFLCDTLGLEEYDPQELKSQIQMFMIVVVIIL